MAEPKIVRDMSTLWKPFGAKLKILVANMAKIGHPAKVIETIRTRQRQQWLYASGRTRPGRILTYTMESRHLVGKAADCMPASGNWNDKVFFKKLEIEAKKIGLETLARIGDYGHVQWTANAETGKKK